MRSTHRARVLLVAGSLAVAGAARADYQVAIDTSAFLGSTLSMAFDLIDGGPPSNTLSVSGFASGGTLGAMTPSGGVTGSLPSGFSLSDSSLFNEYLQNIIAGTNITFTFSASANGPAAGSLPDTFSFFLLDPGTGSPRFNTTDPTGAASLFTLQIDGSAGGLLSTYASSGTVAVATWTVTPVSLATAVPEPSAGALFAIGGVYLLVAGYIRRARRAELLLPPKWRSNHPRAASI